MISDSAAIILGVISLASLYYMVWCLAPKKTMFLIHKMYLALCASFVWWSIALIWMKFTDPANAHMLYVLDALTNVSAAFSPVFMLLVAMSFVSGAKKMPRKWLLLFIIPAITCVVVWINPLHHLQYQVFSVIRSEVVFGPYIYVAGVYNYICTVTAIILMLRFAIKNKSRLYMTQCLLFAAGDILPLFVSIYATFGSVDMPITATPLSFITVLIFHYFAIYRMHLLDIRPVATQHVLDWISDCYLVLSEHALVVSYNKPFQEVFGARFGIAVNKYLKDAVKDDDISGTTAIYNLITAVESCRSSLSAVTYEQAVSVQLASGEYQKYYYIADITPLFIDKNLSGFVVIFKDFTQTKKSMQQLQESQRHMMEQERLAFLGQMVGGLAHNLKTPIMSISGCMSAVDMLVNEANDSLGDPEVLPEDYQEILGEIRDWVMKTRDACAYMSDIITAIKGQAANVSTSQQAAFTLDELIKRSSLLMRHELMSSGCQLVSEYDPATEIILTGDINNLVQVINNLVSNAIYAEKLNGSTKIFIGVEKDEAHLSIYVKDTGPGVDERVRKRLFNEMITSKGTGGTGLGLFISNAVVRGKFGGKMWVRDNPGGGSVFGLSIPLEKVTVIGPAERSERAVEQ